MKRLLISLALAAAAGSAFAADVGVSISVGQPGFYGQIHIGDFPPPVLVAEVGMVRALASGVDERLTKRAEAFWPGPLTIVLPRKPIVPDAATGGLDTVALRCPDHDICRAFLRYAGVPVAGPSANLSTRPSPTTAAEAARVSPWLWMSLTHRTAPRKLTVSPSAWPPTWWRRSRASRLI